MVAKNGAELILFKFGENGELIEKQVRMRPAERIKVRVSYEFHRLAVDVPEEFVGWQEEIGLKHQTISVKKFFDEESRIGIEELPAHYREFVADPGGYIQWLWEGEDYTSDELDKEIGAWRDEIKRWNDQGMFVFRYGNDYYCNQDGDVISS